MVNPITIDFSKVPDIQQHPTGYYHKGGQVPKTKDGKVLNPKQIRARARRKLRRLEKKTDVMTKEEAAYLYKKPIDEWDLDELAAGRPRDALGRLSGRKPAWITTAVHEEAMTRYQAAVKSGVRGRTTDALEVITRILTDDERDEKGKPLVPAATKLQAAQWIIEHAIGKPKQQVEGDISVKLQGILGTVLVNPADFNQTSAPQEATVGQGLELAHYPGITIPLGTELTDDDDDLDYGGEG